MIKRKWLCISILIIALVGILSACNKTSSNENKDNNTTIEPPKVDPISNTDTPSMALNNKVQASPDVSSSAKDSTIQTKIMSSDKKEPKEEDFEITYKNVIINKNARIEDITKKLGFPEDYDANNQGYISGDAKYRRWNLCYPNYSNPEIRIIVLSERKYIGEEVKDGDSYIVGIYLEEYSTNRGLKVGNELAKILELYGKPNSFEKDSDNAEGLCFLRYSKGGSNLDITLDNDMKNVKYIFVDYNMKKSQQTLYEETNTPPPLNKSSHSPGTAGENQNTSILKLKYIINVGMDADLLIDSIDSDSVSYRFYDYQHESDPDKDAKTVAFSEMLKTETEYRVYLPVFYIDKGDSEIELNSDKEFISKFESDKAFRERVGKYLNKPVHKEIKENVLNKAFFN